MSWDNVLSRESSKTSYECLVAGSTPTSPFIITGQTSHFFCVILLK